MYVYEHISQEAQTAHSHRDRLFFFNQIALYRLFMQGNNSEIKNAVFLK